ncbi:hypothetical protein ES707_12241 [subsurface metagenome]
MKRVLIVFALIVTVTIGASALDYATFADAFQDFADEVANTLPATAGVAGLSWSPAYIGQFPHFGVGVSLGASTMPYDFVDPLISQLGVTLPSEFKYLEQWGLPIPAAALDARLGGFFFPFDVGFKIGFVPDQLREKLGKVNLEYMLVGGDVRIPLLKDRGLVPALSISGGYTFMRGNVGVPDIVGTGNYVIDMLPSPYDTASITVTAPELTFTWETHTMVAKLQASKNLLIFTPHVGLGAAYGISEAGGGLSSEVTGTNIDINDPAEVQALQDALALAVLPVPDLDSDSILVTSAANGYSFWIYGGTAINILIVKVDLSAMYNIVNGGYGASVNVRVQL